MKIKKFQKAKTLIFCSLLVLCVSLSPVFSFAQTMEELESKQAEIDKQLQENRDKLEENADKRDEQSDKVSAIQSELDVYNNQIAALDSKISVLGNQISQLNGNIYSLGAEIESINSKITETKITIAMQEQKILNTREKVIERLALSYMMGEGSSLEMLFGLKSLSEALTWRQFMQNASDYDRALIESLEDEIADLNELNSQLEADITSVNNKISEVEAEKQTVVEKQSEVQASANELEVQKQSVEERRSEAVALLKQLDKESAEYKRIEKMLIAEQEKVDAEIDALIASQGSSAGEVTVENDGTLAFPLRYSPSECVMSAPFGQYPSGGTHRGVDMYVRAQGKTYGAEILAAQSGKVLEAGWHSTMGNYIILDHGNGLNTVYMHCSSLKVSKGMTVNQGQVIGLVGNTGNSSGPHLHFEVRISGKGAVNPGNYITLPSMS
ncbi:MAG: peptidoglycan DD-metalloendopeptidase family protein [Clostridia bacterium]|nr:peptidoglycan DD-metalloendopeptidase family protein [Clostridia bacterium]